MSKISVDYNILNQKQTPAFYASSLATRPAFGFPGRIFIDTDTPSSGIYRDTGSAWVQVADPGAGTTGTLQQVTTNGNTTTNAIVVQGVQISDGAGTGLYNTGIGAGILGANTTGAGNTAIGNSALAFNTTGNNNIGIGSQSLFQNTTGNSNTAVGSSALQNNSIGTQNTAIGSSALSINIIGNNNSAIGFSALFNSTGNSNTAIGSTALQNNSTGNANTALGYASLFANTTGISNTALGTNSLGANTTASDNTAIGNASLFTNTTGALNTAVGRLSLFLNTTGGSNTAIGYSSLYTNTTGLQNTTIGTNSLYLNTTGNGNTAIGYNAGSSITTGSNNTILGNYVGTSTLTNNIVLSDGAGNVRLFSDANGLIAINQSVGSVPGGQLDIHTTQTYALVLNGLSTSNAYTAFSNASVGKWYIGNTYNAGANNFDIFNLGTSTNSFRIINSTNNVLIGTTTDDTISKLQVNGIIKSLASNNSQAFNASSATTGWTSYYLGNSGANIEIAIDRNTGGAKFTGGGAYASGIIVNGNHDFYVQNNGTIYQTISPTGVVTLQNLAGTGSRAVLADASGNLSAPVSDISVKENINSIGYGLNEILKMNPVWFDYIDEYKNYGKTRQNGNIAQEMECIIPEAVFTTPSTGKMGINYDQLHAVYIKAIQELKAEIDALKNN